MIRTATAGDAWRIAGIQVASWRAAYRGIVPESYFEALDVERCERTWKRFACDPDSSLLVVCGNDGISGFCLFSPSRDSDTFNAGEIIAIYIDPGLWRKGLGRALCASALEFARERGFDLVTLWTLTMNDTARRFYESLGFQPDGASKNEVMSGITLNQIRYRLHINRNEVFQAQ